jgi:hypothetical protein
MASVGKAIAYTGAVSGNGSTPAMSLEALTTDFIPTVQISALGAGTTLAVVFQHSPDGSTWDDVATLQTPAGASSLTATGIVFSQLTNTTPIWGNVRFSYTFTGGTTTATAIFSVYYDKRR